MQQLTITKELLGLLLFTSLIALTVNYFHPNGLSLTTPYSPGIANTSTQNKNISGPSPIHINVAASLHHSSECLFVDARSQADYDICHIQNAVNLPEHHFEQYLDNFMSKTSPDQTIIAYCGSADCPLGAHLAEKLFFMGFEKVFHLAGGMDAWEQAHLPVQGQ